MKVTECQARELLKGLGYAKAAGAKVESLAKKLNDTKSLTDGKEVEGDSAKLLSRILKTLEDGKTVEIVPDAEAVKDEPAEKPKKPKAAAKASANGTGHKAERNGKEDKRERDKFGSVVGSSDALVNAVLGKKPMTTAKIKEKTGLPPSKVRYAHLHSLVAAGHAIKTDNGWALK